MKNIGLISAAAATAGLAWAGHYRSPDFYPAALVAGFVFFRLATGSACPPGLARHRVRSQGPQLPHGL